MGGEESMPPISVHYVEDSNEEVALKPFIPSHSNIPLVEPSEPTQRREGVEVEMVNSQEVKADHVYPRVGEDRVERGWVPSKKALSYREMRRMLYEQTH